MQVTISERLAANCRTSVERSAWLERLPKTVVELARRWSLTLGRPFEKEVSCAWVAAAERADGSSAVLKIGMPHLEGQHEIDGLRFWDGDPTVRLLEADDELGGMLLERCQPGVALRTLPALTAAWSDQTLADAARWPDAGLVRQGLDLFRELPRSALTTVLLATDLHAGNVLRAQREPWLVIDPKPFLGDPAYDSTQHLFNCERLRSEPQQTVQRFADLLGLDQERVRLWVLARAAAEPRETWDDDRMALARTLAP
jgi:streptomycin 6-kinase